MTNLLPEEALFNIGVKALIVNSQGLILLLNIKRKTGKDTYWDLPGGRIVDGESPEQTLIREIKEETGINSVDIERHLIMVTSSVLLSVHDTKKVGVIFSVYLCHSDSEVNLPEDRVKLHWLTKKKALKNLRTNPVWPESINQAIEQLQI